MSFIFSQITSASIFINFQYMRQQVDQRIEVVETKKKKELVQQIQDKTDAILEEIKAVLGTSGTRTSRETTAAMSNLEKTFWGDMEPIIKGESGPIRARLNQEVDRRVKAAVARVDKDGDRSLSKHGT